MTFFAYTLWVDTGCDANPESTKKVIQNVIYFPICTFLKASTNASSSPKVIWTIQLRWLTFEMSFVKYFSVLPPQWPTWYIFIWHEKTKILIVDFKDAWRSLIAFTTWRYICSNVMEFLLSKFRQLPKSSRQLKTTPSTMSKDNMPVHWKTWNIKIFVKITIVKRIPRRIYLCYNFDLTCDFSFTGLNLQTTVYNN